MRTAFGHARHGADQREGIDAEMPAKMSILVQEQGVDELRTDLGQGRPHAILLIARERQPQQLAILGVDRCRQGRITRERCMWQNSQQHQHEHRTRRDRTRPDCEAPLHGESTMRCPAADRARIEGLYMDSPYEAGTT